MAELCYISEGEMRALFMEEIERAREMERFNIRNPECFFNHSIATGNTAYELSLIILSRNGDLREEIDPDVARATGYFHDFAKIGGNINNPGQEGGDMWHDLEGPFMVLTRNAEFGLVRGGTAEIRREKLAQIALGISSDFALAEEMGPDFPETAAYQIPGGLIERAHFLRKALSRNDEPISWEMLVFPNTIARKIVQYADRVPGICGGEKRLIERLTEEIERYNEWADEFTKNGNYEMASYYRCQVKIASNPKFRQRLMKNIVTIEKLLN